MLRAQRAVDIENLQAHAASPKEQHDDIQKSATLRHFRNVLII
jgi:hypothetical protein